MDLELSDEHEAFRKVVRDFARAEIAPHAEAWDRDHHFPVDVVRSMGELGLFGLTAPGEFGGAGADGDSTALCVAIEELGRVDQSLGVTLEAGVGLGINPILTFGTPEQQQLWLPDLVAGAVQRDRLRGADLVAVRHQDLPGRQGHVAADHVRPGDSLDDVLIRELVTESYLSSCRSFPRII